MERGPRVLKIRVINLDTGREDVHNRVSREEADWINLSPNLNVEVLEVFLNEKSERE